MIVLSHPTGNEFVRHALEGLFQYKILQTFYTSFACFEGDMLYKLGGLPYLSELRKRKYDPRLKPFTKTNPLPEILRQLALKGSMRSLLKHEEGILSIDKIYQNHDQFVANNLIKLKHSNLTGILAYEDAAIKTFINLKEKEVNKFYDLSIGYYKYANEIFEKEKDRQPEYAQTLTSLHNSQAKLDRKDQELYLADQIIVASKFTAETLKMANLHKKPIKIIPYGFPKINNAEKPKSRKAIEPLKVLYVGGLTQRKGIAEVFDSVKNFGNQINLTVIGRTTNFPCEIINKNLNHHRYIVALSHPQILAEMFAHDILLLPSFFEGFGMVISEAMSQGTAVITTKRTGAADFIDHGINGWMVEPGNLEEITQVLEVLINNPDLHREVGINAKATASLRPWSKYSEEIAEFLGSFNK